MLAVGDCLLSTKIPVGNPVINLSTLLKALKKFVSMPRHRNKWEFSYTSRARTLAVS